MNTAVLPKTARRQGVTKENILHGSSTEKQRSRRAVFGETLRAEALLARFVVASRLQITADMLARRSSNQTKTSLSSNVHSFSTGCQAPGFAGHANIFFPLCGNTRKYPRIRGTKPILFRIMFRVFPHIPMVVPRISACPIEKTRSGVGAGCPNCCARKNLQSR
jgi:hypothetical protein